MPDSMTTANRLRSRATAIPITVEVSAQFWKAEGFQAWEVAERCFRHLSAARNALPESP